jgi:hypothetical protein
MTKKLRVTLRRLKKRPKKMMRPRRTMKKRLRLQKSTRNSGTTSARA